ncbi:clathrin interactor EPSIN 1 isoform X1 [Ananas comosus]|uniref:Clathrin interactor EPSIN 1 isoform X1 n=1 Tax=Ananas comosus TaxID=4615 RepID=A0A6P5FRN9_ANACO|nr:clathrin interactor EPSIN 1 isoform X1 [Ananas comosus]
MDFMKVFNEAVRDIKREVNLRVLKVPEIEQKVLDATNDEPWGPHGSALSELAQATKKFTECQMVMNVLWTRLTDTGPNWRHVYKALTVVEYLIANGSERAVDDILEHGSEISVLSKFEYVEPNGKDVGINVRKKVETIMNIVNDKEKIKAAREKAAATRDKFFGLSSTGITYKSSSASYGSSSSSYSSSDRYGSLSGSREADSFKDNYTTVEQGAKETKSTRRSKDSQKSNESISNETGGTKIKKGVTLRGSDEVPLPSNSSKPLNKPGLGPPKIPSAKPASDEDDFDDFDPRGSSTAGSANTSSNQVDLFGPSLMDDFIDVPISTATEINSSASAPEADLFADATFQSAAAHTEASADSNAQSHVDLFAGQPSFPAAFPSKTEFSAAPNSNLSFETKTSISEPANTETFDPFAAIPLNSFEGSDPFGAFASSTVSTTTEPLHSSAPSLSDLNQTPLAPSTFDPFTSSTETASSKLDQTSSAASKSTAKKDTFQVKSGIWADSLSRGLIDLNITAPKKVDLTDIGIVGGLSDGSDEKEKGLPASAFMGRAMGTGTGWGMSGISSSTVTGGSEKLSTLGKQQFGNFK